VNPFRNYEDDEREAIQIEGATTTRQREEMEAEQWHAGRRNRQGPLARSSPLQAERQRKARGETRR
jgi:hypothetical protein